MFYSTFPNQNVVCILSKLNKVSVNKQQSAGLMAPSLFLALNWVKTRPEIRSILSFAHVCLCVWVPH